MDKIQAKKAFEIVKQLLAADNKSLDTIAKTLKEHFDDLYGETWQCIVGNSFGCYVTHIPNQFLYFNTDLCSVLLYRTA